LSARLKQKKQNRRRAEVFLLQLLPRLAGMRSAIAAAMFGVFAVVSMYLSAEGLVRRLASHDASALIAQSASTAVVPRGFVTGLPRGFVSITPAGESDGPASEALEKAAAPGPWVCRLSLLIDSDCLFD